MLDKLFGSKSVEKILLFLFVNGKCYGTQLHRALRTPLTPLQKALNRLEQGGIISSYFEGKTRLYHFNASYPLLIEVEQLLKKVYTLLPPATKKQYYIVKEESLSQGQKSATKSSVLEVFWDKLMGITKLSFQSKTKIQEENGRNGTGRGEVEITKEHAKAIIFTEKGLWHGTQSGETNFSNIFRWTIDRKACVISLEHLRRGAEHPVFLFHLAPSGPNSLMSVDSHLCGDDAYLGQIHFDNFGFRLNWRVIGPKKNEEIDYHYS